MDAMSDDTLIKEALECFQKCEERESENRRNFKDDIAFARLDEQWPAEIRKQREIDGRPCLTINKVAPVIRQIVNDARLNRPAISVRPVDGKADVETAGVITGLIRNIESSSDADIAYDTAVDNSVSGGFGYFRINLDYANDVDPAGDLEALGTEAFEKDIVFERVVNSLSVFGDPDSKSATSDDWNVAFVFEDMPRKEFEKKYPKASLGGFHGDELLQGSWLSDKTVRVAEYWKREKTEQAICLVEFPDEAETQILRLEDYQKRQKEIAKLGGRFIGVRKIPSFKVTQYLMTASEILETNDWPGIYIPIVPVYGDEVYHGNRRHLRSVIRSAKDPNRMFNYWRTTATEMVALAPKAPYLIEEGAIVDPGKWATANSKSYPYLEYKKGMNKPGREEFSGVPTGAMQEALSAADDIKAVTGMYDASLGAKSNETSGKAINARQREGDVSSFHFIDNLTRAIRHAGRIILDLIPKVYSTPRMIRVLGEDGEAENKPINGMTPEPDEKGELQRVYDLRVGRYDLAVTAGPSFTTRREEAATQMMELIRSYPDAAPVIGDLLVKALDWQGADEIAERLKKMLPPQLQEDADEGLPPEVQQQMAQMQEAIQVLTQRLQEAESKQGIDAAKVGVEKYKAETERMTAVAPAMGPAEIQAIVLQTLQDLMTPNGLPEGEGQPGPTAFAEPNGLAA
jgi:hypothetical protein